MFVFLAIFIVFLLYINFLMHKINAPRKISKTVLGPGAQCEFHTQKDISNLNYLIITEDKIPQNLTTDAKNHWKHYAVRKC